MLTSYRLAMAGPDGAPGLSPAQSAVSKKCTCCGAHAALCPPCAASVRPPARLTALEAARARARDALAQLDMLVVEEVSEIEIGGAFLHSHPRPCAPRPLVIVSSHLSPFIS
jgi:hypothetical protein